MLLKKLPRQVIILSLVSLFTDIASEMLYPVTPLFLSAYLGASMAAIGLIEGAAEITAGLLKGYAGALSDKLGKRSLFVTIGYGLSALSKPFPGIFPNFGTVLASRVGDRIGKGIRTAPRDALLASYANNNNTGAIFGFHRGMDTAGAVLGPIAALLLLSWYNNNYKLIYLLAFIPSLAAVAFTFAVKDRSIPVKNKKRINFAFYKTAPAAYKKLLLLFTVFSFVNSSDVFLILKVKQTTGSDFQALTGYIFYNLIYALSSYPAGLLSDKFSKKNIFGGGILLFSIVYTGFASAGNGVMLWLLFGLYGIYAAATEGILKAWISDIIPNEERGTAIGLITMLSSFAILGGSIIAGLLWDAFGAAMPFYLTSAVSFIVGILIFVQFRTSNNKERH